MEQQARNETRDYTWKWFALNADQRLRTFNFYLLIVAVVLGGLLAYLKDARSPAYAAPVGVLLAIISYIFWRLDQRTREFLHLAERILKAIEMDIPGEQVPEELRLFVKEEALTEELRKPHGRLGWNPVSWIRGHYSFHDCFKAAFVIFGVAGLLIGVAALCLPGSSPTQPPPLPQQNFYIGNQAANPPHQPIP
jgi:hypothetical protein